MRCDAARQAMAVYRELDASGRRRVEEHVASCAACAQALAAYRRQDEILGALPEVTPRPAWVAAVRGRTVARPASAAASFRRWVPVTAIALLIFLSGSLGTIQATNQALPGDWLYPVKRTVEQVRLSFIRSEQPRSQYLERVRSTRLEETREVLALGREAEVEFEAPYSGRDGYWWTIDGLRVLVPPEVWPGDAPPRGAAVRVRARASDGTLKASAILIRPTGVPSGGAMIEHAAEPHPVPVQAQDCPTPSVAPTSGEGAGPMPPEPTRAQEPAPEPAGAPTPPEPESESEPPADPGPVVTGTPQPEPAGPGSGESGRPGGGNSGRRPQDVPEAQPPRAADTPEPDTTDPSPPRDGDAQHWPSDHARGRPPERTPPGLTGRERATEPPDAEDITVDGAASDATQAPEAPVEAPRDPQVDPESSRNPPAEPPGQAVAEERREEHGRPENPGSDRGH